MAKEIIYLKGKVKWFRPDKLNEWGKWSHVIYPNAEGIEKIRELQAEGVKNVLKKDDDGYFVTIGRAGEIRRRTDQGGIKMVGMAPPEVMDKDGNRIPNGVMVGNGSDITSKVEVYQHGTPGGGKAKAMRWLGTRVDNLIPYEREKDDFPTEVAAKAGLKEQSPADEDMF